jgi:hypothetical protein
MPSAGTWAGAASAPPGAPNRLFRRNSNAASQHRGKVRTKIKESERAICLRASLIGDGQFPVTGFLFPAIFDLENYARGSKTPVLRSYNCGFRLFPYGLHSTHSAKSGTPSCNLYRLNLTNVEVPTTGGSTGTAAAISIRAPLAMNRGGKVPGKR